MKLAYKYESPINNGLTEVTIPKSRLKLLLPNRKINLLHSPRVYINIDRLDDRDNPYNAYIIEWRPSKLAISLAWLLLPIAVLGHGPLNWKEVYTDTVKYTNPEKYGSFSADSGCDNDFARKLLQCSQYSNEILYPY